MPVYRGAGGAGDATNDATVTAVQAAATSAATSATNAANSATAAATSATGAATSATNASNSATTAAGSVATAAGHATNASTFATNASLSATDAEDAATEAEGYASEANDAEVAASASASAAAASEAAALAAQGAAETAYDDTLAIFGDAADVANAVAAAQLAETNAETAETNAETAATTATNAASTATTQAAAALVSANNADADATAASIDANEAQAAATAAQAAVSSATAIYGSIEDIQQAEANSLANRDAAAASATSASNSASTATTQAGIATTQASAASASAAAASAVALGNEPVRHSVRPSLLLDFANTKTLDPRITFTRASTGTFYDGKTVAKAEENLFRKSQELDDSASWSPSNGAFTANATTAPDSTSTAELFTPTAVLGAHYFTNQAVASVNASGTITYSIFVKPNGYTKFGIREQSLTGAEAVFDCTSTGSVFYSSAGTGSGLVTTITAEANGYYRCRLTITAASGTFVGPRLFVLDDSYTTGNLNSYTYTADGTSGMYVWGAQAEQRSSATAYTATTTAPITNYIPALQSAASGVARFEHNPTTGESLGLEIEEQRTNLFLYSSDYSNAYWTKDNANITTAANVSPDGSLNSQKIVPTTASTSHGISKVVSTTNGTAYAWSFYAKAGEYYNVLVFDNFGGNSSIVFDTRTGTQTSGSTTGVVITSVGNGWYRYSRSLTSTGGNTFALLSLNNSGVQTYAGNDFNGIYIWGAQLEAGAFATSYIPTVASQVTRSADSASMTGTNFSSWYNTSEGTIYGEGFSSSNAPNIQIASIDDATSNNRIDIRYNGSTLNSSRIVMLVNGTTTVNLTPVGTSLSLNRKISFAMKVNDVAASANASSVFTGTTTAMPIVSRLLIGFATYGTDSNLNGTIKKLAYYPKRLQNSELQALTTI